MKIQPWSQFIQIRAPSKEIFEPWNAKDRQHEVSFDDLPIVCLLVCLLFNVIDGRCACTDSCHVFAVRRLLLIFKNARNQPQGMDKRETGLKLSNLFFLSVKRCPSVLPSNGATVWLIVRINPGLILMCVPTVWL